jgi:hypothetical protein
MALNIQTEQLQDSVLEFLEKELGNAWNELPEQQRDLIVRVAINYGRENVKLLIAELFKGIDKDEVQANIEQIKSQLMDLGVVLQAQVLKALNLAIANALSTLLAQYTFDRYELPEQ